MKKYILHFSNFKDKYHTDDWFHSSEGKSTFLYKNHQKYLQLYIISWMFRCLQISTVCYYYSSLHSIFSCYTAFFFVFQKRSIFTWNNLIHFLNIGHFLSFIFLLISYNLSYSWLFKLEISKLICYLFHYPYIFFTALIYTSNCFPSLYYYLLLICVDEVCRFYMAG